MLEDTSVRSTLGSRTLLIMRQFVADVEKDHEEESGTGVSELNVKESRQVKDTRSDQRHEVSCQEGPRTLNKDAIKALRKLLEDFEDQLQCQSEGCEDVTSDEGQEEDPPQEMAINSTALVQDDEENDDVPLSKEPQLYLCDDWIQPMAAMSRPRELTAKEKVNANVAKNCLIVTLMSLELGYGSILERYQQEGESIVQRYEQPRSESRPVLNSVLLTDEEFLVRRNNPLKVDTHSQAASAAMPPPTRLSLLNPELAIRSVETQGMKDAVKNANLKMYHVMSVKQTLREDLAEHAYQFSCRAADWSRSDFSSVPMRFEPARDEDGTVWCDQSKYILHCMRENEFIDKEGRVVLRRATALPTVDEKLGEEEGTIREKNDALIMCRKYIGQMMWLTTRTRPDIAACLGILASLMVRRPQEVKNHLVSLWRYLWTTKDHAMYTLPSPEAARKIQKDECAEANPSGAQDGPLPCPSPLIVQTYCDASFALGG